MCLSSVDRVALACSAVALLVYANTLTADFAYDDTRAILQNPDVRWKNPISVLLRNDFWGTSLDHPGSHKSYRPLTTLTFKLNHFLSGFHPFPYHLFNVFLHCLCTYLFAVYSQQLYAASRGQHSSRSFQWLSGLVFAVHPIHTEAVAGVVGRAELLAAVFFLLALITHEARLPKRPKPSSTRRDTCNNNNNYNNHTGKASAKGVLYSANSNASSTYSPPAPPGPLLSKSWHDESYESHYAERKRSECTVSVMIVTALAGAAMLSKEQGITVIAICMLRDMADRRNINQAKKGQQQPNKKQQRSSNVVKDVLTYGCGAAFLLAIRGMAMGFSKPFFAKADNPAASSDSFMTRLLTFLYLPAFNGLLLALPEPLSFDWSMEAIPLVSSLLDPRNVVTMAFYACLCIAALRASSALRVMGLALLCVPFLPATNGLFYVGFVVAERILYLPSMGYCLLLAEGLLWAQKRADSRYASGWSRFSVRALLTLTLLSFAAKTTLRNRDWSSEERLYAAGTRVNPPKAFGNLANVLSQKGQLQEAEKAFKLALQYRPNMADAHYNLGVLYQNQNHLNKALESYKRAIHYRPKLILAHLNLGLCQSSLGESSLALATLKNALLIPDDLLKDPGSHRRAKELIRWNLARLLLDQSSPSEALKILNEAKTAESPKIMGTRAEALASLGRLDEAEKWYKRALKSTVLEEEEIGVPAMLKYGKLLAKNKTRLPDAENLFQRAAASSSPSELPSSLLHLGLFLLETGRPREAGEAFERAVSHEEQVQMQGSARGSVAFEAAFNAGVAFRQAGTLDKAETFYRKAMHLRPEDPSSHSNLGAMLHLVGKLHEAEAEYLRALELSPAEENTRINLKRLHNVMRSKGMAVRDQQVHRATTN